MQRRSPRGVGLTSSIEGGDMQEPRLRYVDVFVTDLGGNLPHLDELRGE